MFKVKNICIPTFPPCISTRTTLTWNDWWCFFDQTSVFSSVDGCDIYVTRKRAIKEKERKLKRK